MPYSVVVRSDLEIVCTKYWGRLDLEDLDRAREATLADSAYRQGMTELTDFSDVKEVEFGFSGLMRHRRRMVDYYSDVARPTVHHVIVPTDLSFGMARMYQTLAEQSLQGLTLILHDTERDALAALALSVASFDDLLR